MVNGKHEAKEKPSREGFSGEIAYATVFMMRAMISGLCSAM